MKKSFLWKFVVAVNIANSALHQLKSAMNTVDTSMYWFMFVLSVITFLAFVIRCEVYKK